MLQCDSICVCVDNMRPDTTYVVHNPEYGEQPISRTYQYRKVMKPMLERKRRARINRCLDELKELMVSTLQAEGENVSKLEKADILELTVRHLHKLRSQHALALTPEAAYAERFRAGFAHCAQEVSQYLAATSTDQNAGTRLLHHLGACIRHMEARRQQQNYDRLSPPVSPESMESETTQQPVWRPW